MARYTIGHYVCTQTRTCEHPAYWRVNGKQVCTKHKKRLLAHLAAQGITGVECVAIAAGDPTAIAERPVAQQMNPADANLPAMRCMCRGCGEEFANVHAFGKHDCGLAILETYRVSAARMEGRV